jgi:hypothetical protein
MQTSLAVQWSCSGGLIDYSEWLPTFNANCMTCSRVIALPLFHSKSNAASSCNALRAAATPRSYELRWTGQNEYHGCEEVQGFGGGSPIAHFAMNHQGFLTQCQGRIVFASTLRHARESV